MEYYPAYNSLMKLICRFRDVSNYNERNELYDAMNLAFNGFNAKFGTTLLW